jgi:hypothetical protein
MFDWVDLGGFFLTLLIIFVVGSGFRALPMETQRRWKRPLILIVGTVTVLASVLWIWLLLTYRP